MNIWGGPFNKDIDYSQLQVKAGQSIPYVGFYMLLALSITSQRQRIFSIRSVASKAIEMLLPQAFHLVTLVNSLS